MYAPIFQLMTRNNVTLTFDGDIYEAFQKKMGRGNVSHTLEECMRKILADGSDAAVTAAIEEDPKVEYGRLKREYDSALADVQRRQKWLEERKTFSDLEDLVLSLGVTQTDQSKLGEVIPKLREQWKGHRDDLQNFILFLEAVRDKNTLVRKMDEIHSKF